MVSVKHLLHVSQTGSLPVPITMSKSIEYMREYMLKRYHRRRNDAIKLLGGKCVICGSVDKLEIDHKDPKTKSYSIGKILTSGAKHKVDSELAKCQLLCQKHHIEKSIVDNGKQPCKHGTLTMYITYKCRCDECLSVQKSKMQIVKQNRRLKRKLARLKCNGCTSDF